MQNKKIQEPETIVDASSILDDYEYLPCFLWLYFQIKIFVSSGDSDEGNSFPMNDYVTETYGEELFFTIYSNGF